mmetsp:Transcript_55750/g.67007  ORF Transcript_55750/g.67007 Transcript_55750/m.67007 type:complete len:101 (+) Transcript_55750:405-707(+)
MNYCQTDDNMCYLITTNVLSKAGRKLQRKKCKEPDCTNYVVQGGVCIRHGAKRKKVPLRDATKTQNSPVVAVVMVHLEKNVTCLVAVKCRVKMVLVSAMA